MADVGKTLTGSRFGWFALRVLRQEFSAIVVERLTKQMERNIIRHRNSALQTSGAAAMG